MTDLHDLRHNDSSFFMKYKPVFAELAVLMDMIRKSVQLLNIKK